jgi:hypothetical protein
MSYPIKTYPLSAIDIRYPQSDPLTKIEKEIDEIEKEITELVSSDPTPEALDEYLLKQMDNPEVDKLSNKERIYIVAGNYDEFEQYARKKFDEWRRRTPVKKELSTPTLEYVYVKDRYTLLGLSNVKGYYIGTAFQRKDIEQIKQAIACVKERAELLEPIKYTFSKLFR